MTAKTRKALGARIRQLRKAEGLTQEKLALMVSVERSHLAKIESGIRNPSIDVVEKIAHGLGLSLSELFEGLEEASDSPNGGKPKQQPHMRYRAAKL